MPVFPSSFQSNGISAHGTIIKRNGVAIAELRDITVPALTRKALETTTHNSADDSYVVGIRRKGDLSFVVNWLPSGEVTHGSVSGVLNAWAVGSKDLYEIDFADGAVWQFSGFVSNIASKAPVDGVFEATITVRPSGSQYLQP